VKMRVNKMVFAVSTMVMMMPLNGFADEEPDQSPMMKAQFAYLRELIPNLAPESLWRLCGFDEIADSLKPTPDQRGAAGVKAWVAYVAAGGGEELALTVKVAETVGDSEPVFGLGYQLGIMKTIDFLGISRGQLCQKAAEEALEDAEAAKASKREQK
jgi:hypothetical protein